MKQYDDRFCFRVPYFKNDRFAGYEYRYVNHGKIEWLRDRWEDWVSKSDILTPGKDQQCTGLFDVKDMPIYEGDTLEDKMGLKYVVCWAHGQFWLSFLCPTGIKTAEILTFIRIRNDAIKVCGFDPKEVSYG